MSFFSWYKNHLFRRPILIQTITTGTLFAAGDIIAQQIVEQRGLKSHNFYRTLRLGGFGLCIAGPSTAIWYRTLDRVITIKNPMLGLLTRVTLDQAIFAPCFITTFFVGQALLEGQENSQILEKLGDTLVPTLINNYKLWPAVQLLNFHFIPLNYRTLVVNCVALGWNTYLSVINKKSSDKPNKMMGFLRTYLFTSYNYQFLFLIMVSIKDLRFPKELIRIFHLMIKYVTGTDLSDLYTGIKC